VRTTESSPTPQISAWIATLPRSLTRLSLIGPVFSAFAEPLNKLRCSFPPLLKELELQMGLGTSYWPDLPSSLSDFSAILFPETVISAQDLNFLPRNLLKLALSAHIGALRRFQPKLPELLALLRPHTCSVFLDGISLVDAQPTNAQLLWELSAPLREKGSWSTKKASQNEVINID
jgi:hypothetical protein